MSGGSSINTDRRSVLNPGSHHREPNALLNELRGVDVNNSVCDPSEEDQYGDYAHLVLSYFMSEAVCNRHPLLAASLDTDPAKMVRSRSLADVAKHTVTFLMQC